MSRSTSANSGQRFFTLQVEAGCGLPGPCTSGLEKSGEASLRVKLGLAWLGLDMPKLFFASPFAVLGAEPAKFSTESNPQAAFTYVWGQ